MPLTTSRHGFAILESEPEDCPCCGQPLPSRSSARGRPRTYCGADCREFTAAMSVVMAKIGPVAARCDTASWKAIRGQVWQMTNTRSATKGTTKAPLSIQVQIVESDNGITMVPPTHKSWNSAWRAVDALTGSRTARSYCRKAKTKKNGLTHVIRVPRSKVQA